MDRVQRQPPDLHLSFSLSSLVFKDCGDCSLDAVREAGVDDDEDDNDDEGRRAMEGEDEKGMRNRRPEEREAAKASGASLSLDKSGLRHDTITTDTRMHLS